MNTDLDQFSASYLHIIWVTAFSSSSSTAFEKSGSRLTARRTIASTRLFSRHEEREQLIRDLERYRALLRFSTDEQAVAAIEQLIREIRDRLDRLETREISRC